MGQTDSATTLSSLPATPTGNTACLLSLGAMTVGPAIAAAQTGDTVLIDLGTYNNDFAIVNAAITIEGNGGMVNPAATELPSNLQGIITVDDSATIDAGDGSNGAGLRYGGGAMVLPIASSSATN